MTSYCKRFIGFPLIITKNQESSILLKQAQWRNDLKREMPSSRETGGAAGIHIILCGNNKSLMKIKKNVWTDRIFKLSVKGTFIVQSS